MSSFEQKERERFKIKQFKEEFLLEFGAEILVSVKDPKPKALKISLEDLESVVDISIKKQYPNRFPNGLRTRKRVHAIVNFRFCFYKIALDMGYPLTYIGYHLGFTHSAVINGNNVIRGLLQTKDTKSVFNINNIYYEIKERFGIDADIHINEYGEDNTKPVLSTHVYQGEHHSY